MACDKPLIEYIHDEGIQPLSDIPRKNNGWLRGEIICMETLPPPADSPLKHNEISFCYKIHFSLHTYNLPKIVTLDGSPPKLAILSCTHCIAAIWSNMAIFPRTTSSSVDRKPLERCSSRHLCIQQAALHYKPATHNTSEIMQTFQINYDCSHSFQS